MRSIDRAQQICTKLSVNKSFQCPANRDPKTPNVQAKVCRLTIKASVFDRLAMSQQTSKKPNRCTSLLLQLKGETHVLNTVWQHVAMWVNEKIRTHTHTHTQTRVSNEIERERERKNAFVLLHPPNHPEPETISASLQSHLI